jgi:hypothetical protein
LAIPIHFADVNKSHSVKDSATAAIMGKIKKAMSGMKLGAMNNAAEAPCLLFFTLQRRQE